MVGFLVCWAGAANYNVLANLSARRRALRLQTFSAPIGRVLSRPLWILLREPVSVAGVGAALGAVTAGLGFPSVGVGILLTFVATAFVPLLLFVSGTVGSGASGLTFESTGLRVHVRGEVACLVPWTSMVEVTLTGPAHYRSVNVRIVDPGRVIASVVPDSPRNRRCIEMFFWMGEPRGEAMSLNAWTGGLDSLTLLRVLRAAKDGPSQQAN